MRILIASQILPWPLNEGGRVAQYRTIEALQDACEFTMVVPVYSLQQEADARAFAEKFSSVTVEAVRCFHVPPGLSRRSRLRRVAAKSLRKLFPAPTTEPVIGSESFHEFCPYYPFDRLNPALVRTVEKKLTAGCDIFQAEFADMLSFGPLVRGRVPSIFVHHQLHFVYARRFMESNRVTDANARYLTERMIQEEAAYLKNFDSIIVFSEVDRLALGKFSPQLAVTVSPFPSPEELPARPVPFTQPCRHFVFVASETHRPNVDGLRWFMQEVWPSVKQKLPGAVIEVIGQWSLAARTSLPHHGDIRFAGFVADLGQALQNKIMVVPVWVGSGIRTKILAAWSASCPVVTTSIGAEGLPGNDGEHFIIADSSQTFADRCVELSENITRLNQMAALGLELVQQNYSLVAVRQKRLAVYEKLLAKL